MIMLYNKEIQDEIDAENAMEMKQSLVCIVPDCHFCPPRFFTITYIFFFFSHYNYEIYSNKNDIE